MLDSIIFFIPFCLGHPIEKWGMFEPNANNNAIDNIFRKRKINK